MAIPYGDDILLCQQLDDQKEVIYKRAFKKKVILIDQSINE